MAMENADAQSDEPKVEPATRAAKLAAKDTFRILIMDNPEHVDQLKAACKDAGHSVISANTILALQVTNLMLGCCRATSAAIYRVPTFFWSESPLSYLAIRNSPGQNDVCCMKASGSSGSPSFMCYQELSTALRMVSTNIFGE